MKKFFCLSLYFKIRNFIFCLSESSVLTMSSWSWQVKICGLKSSIEVQLLTVSGNLKKMLYPRLYSCLCTSFVSCYCVLKEKIDENSSVVIIDHFSRFRVGSLLASFGGSKVWPGGLLQATVLHSHLGSRSKWPHSKMTAPRTTIKLFSTKMASTKTATIFGQKGHRKRITTL